MYLLSSNIQSEMDGGPIEGDLPSSHEQCTYSSDPHGKHASTGRFRSKIAINVPTTSAQYLWSLGQLHNRCIRDPELLHLEQNESAPTTIVNKNSRVLYALCKKINWVSLYEGKTDTRESPKNLFPGIIRNRPNILHYFSLEARWNL